jgi:hypothetical protein
MSQYFLYFAFRMGFCFIHLFDRMRAVGRIFDKGDLKFKITRKGRRLL